MIDPYKEDTKGLNPSRGTAHRFRVNEGVEIEGSVVVRGVAEVDGIVTGRIEAMGVVVGRSGEIHGLIVADEAIIVGATSADIYANRIVLKPGCVVTGEINHQELLIEPSALFEGKSRRVRNPRALAPETIEFVNHMPPLGTPIEVLGRTG